MSSAASEYETDEEREDREAAEAEAARTGPDRNAAARRRAEKERDTLAAELADAKAKNAGYERRDALDKARTDLNAEGPLNAFLRTYDGEPTATAIKAAVEADPEFSTLVTFTPDPRDQAAAEQGRNAALMAGGAPAGAGQIDAKTIHGWTDARKREFRSAQPDLWSQMLREPEKQFPAPVGWA